MKILGVVAFLAVSFPAAAFADGVPQANQDGFTCAGFKGAFASQDPKQAVAQYSADMSALSLMLGLYDNLSTAQFDAEAEYVQLHTILACSVFPGMTFPDALDAAELLYQVQNPPPTN